MKLAKGPGSSEALLGGKIQNFRGRLELRVLFTSESPGLRRAAGMSMFEKSL